MRARCTPLSCWSVRTLISASRRNACRRAPTTRCTSHGDTYASAGCHHAVGIAKAPYHASIELEVFGPVQLPRTEAVGAADGDFELPQLLGRASSRRHLGA